METLLRDFRYGLRMLVRSPGVTAVAVLALALGIGANTAMFSVVYAVLLRPLPVQDAERLVSITSVNPRFSIGGTTTGYPAYAEWKQQSQSFESMAAASAGSADLTIHQHTERVPSWRVTASFLPTLGVRPVLGRAFLPEEDQPGAGHVALLSYSLWEQRFAGDVGVVGNTITLDGSRYTVVGVLPLGFHLDGRPADVYAPIALSTAPTRRPLMVSIYARLKPGVTLAQAQAEMDTICRRQDRGKWGWGARLWGIREIQVRDVRLSLLVLLAAVGLVLLIACANIASLLLARASARQREVAIRTALGAGRKRLIRQFLTESTLLALLGGVCGLLLAAWSVRLVPLVQTERLPGLIGQTRIDGAVLAFTMLVSLLTGLIFGAAPALSGSQANVHETLKEGGRAGESRRRKHLWHVLVVSETALALLLMIGATLLIRSFFYLRDVAPGLRAEGLFTASIELPRAKYPKAEPLIAFYQQVLEKVQSIPGVQSVGLATALPLSGDYWAMSLPIEGQPPPRPGEEPILWHRSVNRDYFRTMQIPLRRGRLFTEQDRRGSQGVVIINEAMARRFWPGEDAIGKYLGKGGAEWLEIVGVVGNVRHQDLTREPMVEVFFHYPQNPPPRATLAVRGDPKVFRDPMLLGPAVGRAVAAVDKDQTLVRTGTMLQIVSGRLAPQRLTAGLIATFAGLALVLAAVGIYGVLSFSVAQRTHEIGVRMALGAQRNAVLRMVVGQATLLALAGIAIGLAGAFALTRVITSLLFGVSATDPRVFAGVSAFLLAVAALASYLPARRAAHVDPMEALRYE